MRSNLTRTLLAVLLAIAACGGDSGSGGTDDENSAGQGASAEATQVDNCTLLSNEEVSTLAGYDLEAGEDSPLGCPYIAPGEDIADIRVVAVFRSGGAETAAQEALPNAAEIIPVDVGEDTVAVTDPSGGAVASILTASGDRLVELSVIFADVPPDDPARIEEAAQLAVTALERFAG